MMDCEWRAGGCGGQATFEVTTQGLISGPTRLMCDSCAGIFTRGPGAYHQHHFVSARRLDNSEKIYKTEASSNPWAQPPPSEKIYKTEASSNPPPSIETTQRRLDKLAGALAKLANFANVQRTLEREALKTGKLEPYQVAEWIEQAITSDWAKKAVTETSDQRVNRLVAEIVGLTPDELKLLREALSASGFPGLYPRDPEPCNCNRNELKHKTSDGRLCEHSDCCPKAMLWQKTRL